MSAAPGPRRRGSASESLAIRFCEHLRDSQAAPRSGERVIVAVSGGADSMVLLHLLRFTPKLPEIDLRAVHVDHGWREGSRADGEWVAGVCRAWEVPITIVRLGASGRVPGKSDRPVLPPGAAGLATSVPVAGPMAARGHRPAPVPGVGPPAPIRPQSTAQATASDSTSETEARVQRLEAFEREMVAQRAQRVALAHHADDQAETVVHRMARGTGPAGLAAMRELRQPGIWRPLLGFWRAELRSYAVDVGLSWRSDPSNRDLRRPRNLIRHRVIPALEEGVAPSARRALVRLAELSAGEEAAWDAALAVVDEHLDVRLHPTPRPSVSMAAEPLGELAPELRYRVFRRLSLYLKRPLSRAGTEMAARFSMTGGHGRMVSLPGGLRLRKDHDRVTMFPQSRAPQAAVTEPSPES